MKYLCIIFLFYETNLYKFLYGFFRLRMLSNSSHNACVVQYSLAKSRDERRNLFLVLFDYVLHQINEACIATGDTEYRDDEIQPLVALLTLADASEAVYISIKLGLVGIGAIMSSISDALSTYPNSERLNMVCIKSMCVGCGLSW